MTLKPDDLRLFWAPPDATSSTWRYVSGWFTMPLMLRDPRRWKRGQKRTARDRRRTRSHPCR